MKVGVKFRCNIFLEVLQRSAQLLLLYQTVGGKSGMQNMRRKTEKYEAVRADEKERKNKTPKRQNTIKPDGEIRSTLNIKSVPLHKHFRSYVHQGFVLQPCRRDCRIF